MKKNKQTSISLFLALLFICSFYNVTIYSSEKKVAKRKHKIINNNHKKQKLSPHNSSNDNMSNNSNNNDNKSNDMNNMCEFFYSLLSEKMEIEKNCEEK